MKRRIAFNMAVLLLILSCGKDRNSPDTTNFLGEWELTQSYSNGIVFLYKNYPKGNGNTITFREDGTFIKSVKIDDSSSTDEYKYHLEKGKFCGHDEPIDTFLYFGNEEPEILRLQNGILSLESTMCVEGGVSAVGASYRKLK